MDKFDERFSAMLVQYRENAIDGLRSNERYAKMEQEQNDLRLELEAISPEAEKLAEKFFRAVSGIHDMECSAALLCGMTVSAEMRKRFDSSTAEYVEFAKSYLDYNV